MKRIIEVRQFDDLTKNLLSQSIEYCFNTNQKILPIYINSGGGSVTYLLSMVDLINAAKSNGLKIVTLTNQVSMSAGAVLFAIGDKRYISKNATLMVHDVMTSRFYMNEKSKETEATNEYIKDQRTKILNILDTATNKQSGYFENLIKENYNTDIYMSSQQAIEHNLATNIGIPTKTELFDLFDDNYNESQRINNLLVNSFNQYEFIKNKGADVDLKEAMEQIEALKKTNESLVNEKSNLETNLTNSQSKIIEMVKNQVKEKDEQLVNDWITNGHIDKSKEAEAKKLLEIANQSSEPNALKNSLSSLISANSVKLPVVPTNKENEHQYKTKSKSFIDFCNENKIDITNGSEVMRAEIEYNKGVK